MTPNENLRIALEALQNVLVSRATGGDPPESDYREPREKVLADASLSDRLPSFVRTCRDLSQFWAYIKQRFPTYRERREHIWSNLRPCFDYLEANTGDSKIATPTAPPGEIIPNNIITFLRKRDYRLVKELGKGACGVTVLLQDDQIDEHFVCKKYTPYSEDHRQELFDNFAREIKLLHKIHHPNVVRVFNYYLYPKNYTGFILMEFIDGLDIDDYLKKFPEQANEVFLQVISGFAYLEAKGILHRDIRPSNIMVTEDGTVKVIDLGFGKEANNSADFTKSISLNWWCALPKEFEESRYDFQTDLYFVGKLFEEIILNNEISHFKYGDILTQMCQREPEKRAKSFAEIETNIGNNRFFEIAFTDFELESYRVFASMLCRHITEIESGAKYVDDIPLIEVKLNDTYRTFMLEESVPKPSVVVRCFISGSYKFKPSTLSVENVREFLRLMKGCTEEKKRIILANLHTKLDAIPRFRFTDEADDIPF